ncbi:MAG: GNAT family N-acetyltransferase [Candidatus Heimdallarchaeota archaeon]|nr:GNAT family N-acetyltransferase [Candidatus Heimdallarchaeota archaeon]
MSYIIDTFNPKEATEKLWELYFNYFDKYMLDEFPDEQKPSHKLEKESMINPNKYYDIYRWIVFNNKEKEKIIGKANLWFENKFSPGYNNVKDIAMFHISVDNEFRQNGIGTKLLKILTSKAKNLDKKVIRVQTSINSGKDFCKNKKGKIVAERGQNRLYISKVNWEMMDKWCEEGQKKACGVTLEIFETVPEKDLEEFCTLYTEVFNNAPVEDLPGKFILTPKRRRNDEKDAKEKEYRWITIISREQTGELSGLTEIYYHHTNPEVIEQELTGVKEDKQKRGLGKWLKAKMLYYIRDEFPKAQYIATGNNDRNAPMLSINNRMGFYKHKSELIFEFSIATRERELGN